jgi:replicative DNA helicase
MSARQSISEEPADLYADREVAQLRIPPNSAEAESSVLAGLLLDAAAWDRIGDLVAESDFYRLEHRLVFAAIAQLAVACKPVDVVTVHEQLLRTGKSDEAGGLKYLAALSQYTPSAANVRRYAEIVRENAILRQLIAASDEIATEAFNTQGKAVHAILDAAQAKLIGIGDKAAAGDDWETVEEGVTAFLGRVQAAADGTAPNRFTPTGLDDLDELLNGGLRPGQLVVIAARPSMGKTALAMSIELHVAEQQREPCAFFSMEMPKAEVTERRTSMLSHIHLSKIQRPERLKDYDWPNLTRAVESLRALRLFVSDKGGLNILQVRARARALKRRYGLRLLTVDYLGLMNGLDPKQPRAYQIEEITKGLKQLAKELDIPVVVLVQLSRETEKRVGQRPILSDLRDSGSIEQDADVVLFVHREKKANPGLGKEWDYYAQVIVAKQRNGPLGEVVLQYVGENTRFENWPEGADIPTSRARVANGGGDL